MIYLTFSTNTDSEAKLSCTLQEGTRGLKVQLYSVFSHVHLIEVNVNITLWPFYRQKRILVFNELEDGLSLQPIWTCLKTKNLPLPGFKLQFIHPVAQLLYQQSDLSPHIDSSNTEFSRLNTTEFVNVLYKICMCTIHGNTNISHVWLQWLIYRHKKPSYIQVLCDHHTTTLHSTV